ncbi:hypothetical protein ATY79_29695 [Rhizobium sp. R693]|nr:hypothetical protein ATY79_29695 [Rhizobium sp. R693]
MGGSWISEGDVDPVSIAQQRSRNLGLYTRALLAAQMNAAIAIVEQNEHLVRKLARTLFERKCLSAEDVRAVIQASG